MVDALSAIGTNPATLLRAFQKTTGSTVKKGHLRASSCAAGLGDLSWPAIFDFKQQKDMAGFHDLMANKSKVNCHLGA